MIKKLFSFLNIIILIILISFKKNKGEHNMKKIYMKPEMEEMKISFHNALMDASQPGAKIDDNQDPIDPGTIESNSGSLWGDED